MLTFFVWVMLDNFTKTQKHKYFGFGAQTHNDRVDNLALNIFFPQTKRTEFSFQFRNHQQTVAPTEMFRK